MKPTKRQRHKIYKDTLSYVKKHGWNYTGFCFRLQTEGKFETYGGGLEVNFPEISKRRPKKPSSTDLDYYFELFNKEDPKRERILKLAIKETAPKPKKDVTHRRKTVSKG